MHLAGICSAAIAKSFNNLGPVPRGRALSVLPRAEACSRPPRPACRHLSPEKDPSAFIPSLHPPDTPERAQPGAGTSRRPPHSSPSREGAPRAPAAPHGGSAELPLPSPSRCLPAGKGSAGGRERRAVRGAWQRRRRQRPPHPGRPRPGLSPPARARAPSGALPGPRGGGARRSPAGRSPRRGDTGPGGSRAAGCLRSACRHLPAPGARRGPAGGGDPRERRLLGALPAAAAGFGEQHLLPL